MSLIASYQFFPLVMSRSSCSLSWLTIFVVDKLFLQRFCRITLK